MPTSRKLQRRLREIARQKNREEQAKNADWRRRASLERGNAGAVFVGTDFRKK